MPKDAHFLPQWSQDLLRAARSGKLYKRHAANPDNDLENEDGDKVDDGKKEEGKDKDGEAEAKGFVATAWKLVPRHLEGTDVNYLAKRRRGLDGGTGGTGTVTKATVKRTDAEGNTYVQDVVVVEGEKVEGEVISTTIMEGTAAASEPPVHVKRPYHPPKRKLKGSARSRKRRATAVAAEAAANGGVVSAEGEAVQSAEGDAAVGTDVSFSRTQERTGSHCSTYTNSGQGIKLEVPKASEDIEMADGSMLQSDGEGGSDGEEGEGEDDEGASDDDMEGSPDDDMATNPTALSKQDPLHPSAGQEPKPSSTPPAASAADVEMPDTVKLEDAPPADVEVSQFKIDITTPVLPPPAPPSTTDATEEPSDQVPAPTSSISPIPTSSTQETAIPAPISIVTSASLEEPSQPQTALPTPPTTDLPPATDQSTTANVPSPSPGPLSATETAVSQAPTQEDEDSEMILGTEVEDHVDLALLAEHIPRPAQAEPEEQKQQISPDASAAAATESAPQVLVAGLIEEALPAREEAPAGQEGAHEQVEQQEPPAQDMDVEAETEAEAEADADSGPDLLGSLERHLKGQAGI